MEDFISIVKHILRSHDLTPALQLEKDELLREFAMYIMKYKTRIK